MLIDVSRQLLAHGAQLVYTATRETGKTLTAFRRQVRFLESKLMQ